MDPLVKQSVANAVTFSIAAAVYTMQAKHEEEIFTLREMIEKSLLLSKSPSPIPPPSPIATFKAHPDANSLPKTTIER